MLLISSPDIVEHRNASLPHGCGTDRTLTSSDLILFDIGGTLHGYYSDLTPTFALRDSGIPTQALEKWFLVQTAQQVAALAAKGARSLAMSMRLQGM